MNDMVFDIRIFLFLFIIISNTLQPMIEEIANQQLPTLKRLAAEAYWKNYHRLPSAEEMNDETKTLLLAYAPLGESTIKDVLNSSKFLNDVARIEECRNFIKENNIKGNDVNIFLTGLAHGIVYHPRQIILTSFAEIKKRRLNSYAEKTNISPDELAIEIEENESEEWVYAAGNVNGLIFCKLVPPAMVCAWGFVSFLNYLKYE